MPDGVQIQTDQVNEFAQGLRADADKGFASAADRGADLHAHGVVFGAKIDSGTVLAAKERYARALENTDANLRAYKLAAGILADVAEQIARDFARVDMSSEAAQQHVQKLLSGAIADADRAIAEGAV
ncbi:hypothetical protein COUCH_31160 [Couchioplanes caeruleus]|uniref:hypothetical protein n=1 Tax=Couchioplanes caeruleus TaxID=56438 RepID=UPI0020C11762|nr:hypothetical protein [Couchioplanes caeruleus]UQU63436.1 hypothetical protein COUCH_31160 [Couchioplanes caeruleus]